ncbi:hypothetical protein WJX73_009625 [Symbiochloris irregularis]|uniref:Importin N-terminal domain-containing protein n=1 Tax=Symbiochloris irregularis TaxID=706552 RepID=A0AAW1PP99_9CHLO
MAAPDLTSFLQSTQAVSAEHRVAAEQYLQQFEDHHFPDYLLSLTNEIANSSKPAESRQIAGVLLKNALSPTQAVKRAKLPANWAAVPAAAKQQIKSTLLSTLATEVPVARHSAALVIAKVAALELPTGQWPDLITTLRSHMERDPPNSGLRQSTLEALGYICEEAVTLDEEVLDQEQVNSVLTAIVQGIGKTEADPAVRLAATVALQNALEFAETNFEAQAERDYLMQVVCEGTIAQDSRVREASFECLAGIAGLHYSKLVPYISEIFKLTQQAIQHDEEGVAKQAIEFWCTICEEELDLQEDGDAGDSSAINHHFTQQALEHLVPLLLKQLMKQEEGQDKDDGLWNLSMAAGTCLGLVASVVGDHIINLVMPFVQENIPKKGGPEDWRCREAATFAFGSVLEGPSVAQLAKLAASGMQFLLAALSDDNAQVRHTTAWTIGRILEFVHGASTDLPLITAELLLPIKDSLLQHMQDEPHIAEKVCYALGQLAAGFKDTRGGATSPLTPFFDTLLQALLSTALKAGAEGEAQLQLQAFEAINEFVRSASADTLVTVQQLTPIILSRLHQTLPQQGQAPLANMSPERLSDLQGLLCGVLQVVVQKLSETDAGKGYVMQLADQCIHTLMAVFAANASTVHEEAMLAVGALTYACGTSFAKYLQALFPVIQVGLQNTAEGAVCQVTVGVLGDVCRAVEQQIAPFCDNVMHILLSNLQSNTVPRELKPQILSAFGDIALALGDQFEKYLTHVLQVLHRAEELSIQQQQTNDEAVFEYNNLLRMGIFEAFSGIFNGMSPAKCEHYLHNPAQLILDFMTAMYNDRASLDESVSRAGVALLGDVASIMPAMGPQFTARQPLQQFVAECQGSPDPQVSSSASWAAAAINKAIAAQ